MDKTLTLFFNGSHSLYLDGVAHFATQALTWLPLALVLFYVIFREHDLRHLLFLIFIIAICILITDQVASGIFKPFFERWRPTHNPFIAHKVDVVNGYRGGYYGFFSSHASNTFGIATFFILLFHHKRTTLSLMAWATLNCWTRLYLGVHYLGDITVGAIFGVGVAFSAYYIYCRCCDDAKTIKYNPKTLHLITTIFLFTLTFITIPWKLLF